MGELSEHEKALVEKYLSFYRELATGKRQPKTDAQKHFVATTQGRAKAESDHEVAYAKYMRIQRELQEATKRTDDGIPEFEEGLPRPGWCSDVDWKKMRTGNFADLKRRQREE